MFEKYKVYGPYREKKTGRQMVVLYSKEHRTTMPYPRYLMALELGRLLTKDEEVDHIDDDPSNNRRENLRILEPWENNLRRSTGEKFIWLTCPQCLKTFSRSLRQHTRSGGKQPRCCSRSCAARYQRLNMARGRQVGKLIPST